MMLCLRTTSCCSYRNVCLLMSRQISSYRVSYSNFCPGVISNICVLPKERKFFTQSFLQHARYFSTGIHSMLPFNNSRQPLPPSPEDQDFITIYRHPDIGNMAIISKMKSVFYIAAIADIGYGCSMFQSPDMDPIWYLTGFILTIAATVGITVYSHYVSRFVGVIRVNDKEQRVKVSHLTFRGTRKDIYLDVKDIVPLLETAYTDDNKVPFLTKDDTVKLQMSLVKGQVLDHDSFYKLFR